MKNRNPNTIRLFTYAQVAIICLFAFVITFALFRLDDVKNVLSELNNNSVPEIMHASGINNHIRHLATLTTILSNSKSEPGRSLAKKEIDIVIGKLNNALMNRQNNGQFLSRQFTVVSQEINELDYLVEHRILIESNLSENKEAIYETIFRVMSEIKTNNANQALEDYVNEILISTVQIEQQNRLHSLRKIEQEVKDKFTNKDAIKSGLDASMVTRLDELERRLISENGLINQKIESLRIIGRTRGRDNFVRNLISDVASSLEYHTYLIKRSILEDATNATDTVAKQTQLAITVGLISALISLAIIYFLYKRIVVRLLSLSEQVDSAAAGHSSKISIQGNDEISKLADTFSIYLDKVQEQEKALLDMTMSDPLTGIPNRRAFEKHFSQALAQAQRNRWYLTLVIVDVDFFKPYNDHYGHSDGDLCLQMVAKKINEMVLRNTDFCARIGGEEFICILPNTDLKGAKIKAEELRLGIEELRIPHARNHVSDVVTISLGVATFPFEVNLTWREDDIIQEADKALYRAKAAGRNRSDFYLAREL